MSRLFRRVTGAFQRKPKTRETSPTPTPNPNPYDRRSKIRNSQISPDLVGEDSDEDDVSIVDEYPSPSPRRRGPARRDEPPRGNNVSLPSVPAGIQPTLPRNPNVDLNPNPDPSRPNPTHSGLNAPQQPSLDGQRTNISANQRSIPTVAQLPTIPVRRNLTALMQLPRRPLEISPHSTLIGFPWDHRPRPTSFPAHPTHADWPARVPPRQRHYLDYEYDYPIGNVVVDGNIPSSIATKINRTVDHDRFGHRHRAFGRSRPNAVRHIREIPVQNSSYYPAPVIINRISPIHCSCAYDPVEYPRPFNHFVAHALPNDPMRYY